MSAEAAVEQGGARKRWVVFGSIAVLLVVGGIAVTTLLRAGTPAAAAVPSEAVTTKTLTVLVSADGTTKATDSTTVYPAVGGTVKHLYVQLGDTVHAGDRLLTVDDADLKTALVQADASLAQAKQGVTQARQILAQAEQARAQSAQSQAQADLQQLQARQALETLRGDPSATPGIADQIAVAERQLHSADAAGRAADAAAHTASASMSSAKASIATAEASLRASQRARDKAASNRASATIDAPVSGVITTLSVADGGTVSAGSAASGASAATMAGASSGGSAGGSVGGQIVISDTSTVKVRVQVNENDLAKMEIGQKALVTVDAAPGLEIPGSVSWISPNGVNTSGVVTYDVDIELSEQSDAVRPDMTATADITAAVVDDALVVPNSAIRVDGTRKYVDVVGTADATKRVYVVTGSSDASSTQVTGDVTSGQRVVTRSAVAPAAAGGMFPGAN